MYSSSLPITQERMSSGVFMIIDEVHIESAGEVALT